MGERPTNRGASTWAMLRNEAREKGVDTQALATSYVIERFISRLEKHDPDDLVTVKGGQSLGYLMRNPARPTKDLDINVSGKGDVQFLNSVLDAAMGDTAADDGIVFHPDTEVRDLRAHRGKEGVRVSINATIHTCRVPFVIDIGMGNEMTFDPIRIDVEPILNGDKSGLPAPSANIYPLENTIAEKILSKVEDGAASIRHKDFYDLWYLHEIALRIGDLRLLAKKTRSNH